MKKTPAKKIAARKGAPLPFEIHATRDQPLGMPVERFLRNYWHKHPLLIRNAFADFQSPLQPEDLAGLACEDGVLARLISHDRATDDWNVRTGPFQETDFPGLPDHDWTLLVQDVDKWDADVRALLEQFRFLPRWRIDDIMISFAATGGSVGAHVDHYDVFLLQGQGHRRWQIDARAQQGRKAAPLAFRDDVELKLLRDFKPTHDWVLGPGDMLYLPPLVPHHGVAEDACLTFSIGTRAPSSAELIGDYLDTLIADADEAVRYHDEDLKVPADPYEIDVTAMNRVVEALNALRMNDPDRLGDWFGRFMTTYRASGDVVPAPEPIPARRSSRRWKKACCCTVTPGRGWPGGAPSVAPPCSAAAWNSRCRPRMPHVWPRPKRSTARCMRSCPTVAARWCWSCWRRAITSAPTRRRRTTSRTSTTTRPTS